MQYTDLSQLPRREIVRWESASVIEGYARRLVTYTFSVTKGQTSASIEQFLDEVSERLTRWSRGEYSIHEAAQVLADEHPRIDAVELCEQMESACREGKLILRSNGLPIPAANLGTGHFWTKTVRKDDINDWLRSSGAGFELSGLLKPTDASPAPLENIARTKNSWDDNALRRLMIEFNEPGSTHAKLAAKYGVSRQLIGRKLTEAETLRGPRSMSPFATLSAKAKK